MIKQFTDLFESRRAQIERESSPLLNEAREAAYGIFRDTGFPAYGMEEYQHTDIGNLLKTVHNTGERDTGNAVLLNHIDQYKTAGDNVPRCHSDELFKYLLSDKSVAAFSGKINVAQDAQKTMAYQNHRNLLNGMDCRVFSKPQLEIYADDVKCSHGMTTGQMDETVLMYMRSRGIPEEEARTMLRTAFAEEIIDGIRDEELKDWLSLSVAQRIRGKE